MSGICGIVSVDVNQDHGGVLEQMLRATNLSMHLRTQSWSAFGVAMGQLTASFSDSTCRSVDGGAPGSFAAVAGRILNLDELVSQLPDRNGRGILPSQGEFLEAGLRAQGAGFLRKVRGSFAAALWNETQRKLTLVSDAFGSQPLYVADLGERIAFGSSLSAVVSAAGLGNEIDPVGLSQFFTFGQYLEDNTSHSAIRVLPAATVFSWSPCQQRAHEEVYWQPGSAAVSYRSTSDALEQVDLSFAESVRRASSGSGKLGLSLSGGLDSRTILAAIDHRSVSLQSVCSAIEGSIDQRCATEIARLVGCRHYGHCLDRDFLASFGHHLRNMVRLTDGQYLSQCIVMPTLPVYRDLGIDVLMRGHGGELMHMNKAYNFSVDREAMAIRSDEELEAWLWKKLQAHMLQGVGRPLFLRRIECDVAGFARQSLRAALDKAGHLETPLQKIQYLFVSQRMRRETPLSMKKFASVTEPRMPYYDADLVDALLAAPADLKLGETAQYHILRKRRPEFLKVTNANTGAPMGAGPLRRCVAGFRRRVFAKLGVRGYQPYERLGLWLRNELQSEIRSVLLSDQCADRGVFDPNTVRHVFKQHSSGQANHTFLLMALTIFEVGQRLIYGEDETPSAEATGISPARKALVGV
jgi:asparagine synthase (glutamine-hydrolysing)